MTCQTIQNRILALPDPRHLPEPFRTHLDACPACLGWWQQAVRLERLLEHLPAPPAPADKKAALLDDLTSAGPVIKSIPALARGSGRSSLAAVLALPGLKYAAGLAAAVLVAVGGWLAVRPGKNETVVRPTPPKHPLLAKVVQRDLALARAKTPAQRLEALGGLADDLSAETRGLARVASEDELRDLSGWFKKVVDDGIVKQADLLPALTMSREQKKALLDGLVEKLTDAGRKADQTAKEAPPHAQPALKSIADTARDGEARLRAILAREGA
jgi:hypothetical protein